MGDRSRADRVVPADATTEQLVPLFQSPRWETLERGLLDLGFVPVSRSATTARRGWGTPEIAIGVSLSVCRHAAERKGCRKARVAVRMQGVVDDSRVKLDFAVSACCDSWNGIGTTETWIKGVLAQAAK